MSKMTMAQCKQCKKAVIFRTVDGKTVKLDPVTRTPHICEKEPRKSEERYVDCDACGERYWGEDDIRRYLREVEIGDEVEMRCPHCLRE